jgi:hypothetical protein
VHFGHVLLQVLLAGEHLWTETAFDGVLIGRSCRFSLRSFSRLIVSVNRIWKQCHMLNVYRLRKTKPIAVLTAVHLFHVSVQVDLLEVNLRTKFTLGTICRWILCVRQPNVTGQIFPILENLIALITLRGVGMRLHVRAHADLVDEQSTVVALDFDSQVLGG